jgi:nucleotidyltransferase substrate binding protein (TIGR01987 family)
MALDLSSLQKAVSSLERAVKVAEVMIKGVVDTDQEEVIRAGVIQNFEFTYELCIKFIKRWIEANVSGSNPDSITFKELLRIAAESQLIQDVDDWVEYREARNETSHTYDNDKADDVFNVTLNFAKDAKQLLLTLEKKND